MTASTTHLKVTCFGVDIVVECRGDALDIETVLEFLPPRSDVSAFDASESASVVQQCGSRLVGSFQLESTGHRCQLSQDGQRVYQTDCRDDFLLVFESTAKLLFADHARERVVVHAGVIGWNDSAILFPGRSCAGKSTLVAELLRNGAEYFSDDFAILDSSGVVHAYDRPLVMRDEHGNRSRVRPEAFGATSTQRNLPVGSVVFTHFDPASRWQPSKISPGEATLKLLANTVSARRTPKTAIHLFTRITRHATLLCGPRGNASQVARDLLI